MPKFICDNCGTQLEEQEALFCPECGSKLRQLQAAPAATTAPVTAAPAAPTVYCTSCGAAIPDSSMQFCPACGQPRVPVPPVGGPAPVAAPAPVATPAPAATSYTAVPVATSPGMGSFHIILDKRATYMEGKKSRGGGKLRLSTYELHYLSSKYNIHLPLTDIAYVREGYKRNVFEIGTTTGAVHAFKLFKAQVFIEEIQRLIPANQPAAMAPQAGAQPYASPAPSVAPGVQTPPAYAATPAPAVAAPPKPDIEAPGGYRGEDQWYNGKLTLNSKAFLFDSKKKDLILNLEEIDRADSTDKGNMFLLILKDGTEHKFRVFKAKSWIEDINTALG